LIDNNFPVLVLKMLSGWFANPSRIKTKKTSLANGVDFEEDDSIGKYWLQNRTNEHKLQLR
jgi:hypothetical protein